MYSKEIKYGNLIIFLIFLYISSSLTYWAVAKFDLEKDSSADTKHYIAMFKKADLDSIPKPFRYRLFTPIFARFIPFLPDSISKFYTIDQDKVILFKFGIVNMIGVTATAYLLFLFLSFFLFNQLERLIGALLYLTAFYTINWTVIPLVDAWAHAFMMFGLYAIIKRRPVILFLSVLIGMLAKETVILVFFAIPLLEYNKKLQLLYGSLCLPGLIIYVFLRFYFFPTSLGYHYPLESVLINFMNFFIPKLQHIQHMFDILMVYGPLWILAIIGYYKARRKKDIRLTKFAYLIAIPMLACFVILENMGRIIFLSFPSVIPLILNGLSEFLPMEG